MSVYVMSDIPVKPEALEQIMAGLKAGLPETRAYDGCEGVDCFVDADDPNNIVLAGKWESKQHYEKYTAWRAESGSTEKYAQMLSGEPSTRYFERLDV